MALAFDPEGVEAQIIHRLIDFRDKNVLEIGCGDGRMTWRFADHAIKDERKRSKKPANPLRGRAFSFTDPNVTSIARYACEDVLMSGWLQGEALLADAHAVVEAKR